MKQIERSKDGVPCWDGDASTYQEYAELAALWEQSVPYHKRYLCGPKLVQELSGTARRFVLAKDPTWVSFPGGVQVLLDHLRQHLGLPQMSEMSDFMAKYFRNSRRHKHETMNDYITRKAELYSRASFALARVQQRYEPTKSATRSRDWSADQGRLPPHSSSRTTSEIHEAPDPTDLPQPGLRSQMPHVEDWLRDDDDGTPWRDPWAQYSGWHQHDDWKHTGYDYGDSSWKWQPAEHAAPSSTSDGLWGKRAFDLLPDFVQGWFLLQDANLETNEKNMILAAIKNDFSVQRVAQELRNQWCDADLKRRDQSQRGSAWVMDEPEAADEDWDSPNYANLVNMGLNEEGLAAMEAAEDEAQDAMAALEKNRRTLRDARARQHFVKMSRQYYKSSDRVRQGERRDHDHQSSIKCLRCGGPHKVAVCPKKHQDQASVTTTSEAAPFVCFADQTEHEQACVSSAFITTQQAMAQGKAVLDGGATKTLASVTALERIMELNVNKNGGHGIQDVNVEDRPTFGFGNSSTEKCISTASLGIAAGGRQGVLRVHTIDKGEGPLLFSIDALRSLGAVIDFEQDLAVFRRLDAHQVIKLERSNTGHQLLPLTEDLFAQAVKSEQPVPSLKEYL